MQAPAFLVGRAGRGLTAQATAGIGGPQPPRISIAANRFTKIDAAGNQVPHTVTMQNPTTGLMQEFIAPFVDLVIIGVNQHVSKVYYDTAYDPTSGEDVPPACFSDNGVGPSSQATKPQAATCAVCPNNVWGSATSNMTGKQTKACSDAKKIAVILRGDPITYQLRIPPATLKNLKAYAHTIGGYSVTGPDGRSRGADLSDVITRVEFESQGVLKFTPIGFIDEQIAQHMDGVTEEKLNMVLGMNDRPFNPNQLAAPAQPTPMALPAPQPPVHVGAPPQPYVAPAPQPVQPTHVAPVAQQPVQMPPTQFVAAQPVQVPPGQPAHGPIQQPAPAPKRGRGRPAQQQPAPAPMPAQPAPTIVQGPPAMMVPQPMQPAPAQPMQPAQPAPAWTPPPVAAPPGAPAPTPQQFGMQPAPAVPDEAMQRAVLDAMNFKPQ